MATMIPGNIEEFETEGEKAFYKFLEGVAKPVGFVELLSSLGLLGSQTSKKDKIGGRDDAVRRR
jgi:hypothetical protein